MRLFTGEVDVSAQGLQGDLAFLELFGAGDLCAAEATAETYANALDFFVGHDFLDRLLHDAAEWQALLESFSDHQAGDGGIGLGIADFFDVELELLAAEIDLA